VLDLTGLAETKVTPAMQRGTELEPAARAACETHTGNLMEPLVLVEGDWNAIRAWAEQIADDLPKAYSGEYRR